MIIFLYGEDTFRSKQKLRALKEKFQKDVDKDGSSVVVLDGEFTSIEKINEAVASSSLFARKRMVIIERIFSNKSKTLLKQLEEYFKSKAEDNDNIIIVWDDVSGAKLSRNKLFNYLIEQKFSQNFKLLSDMQVSNWVNNELAPKKVVINPQALNVLISMFGNDLWTLNNEINVLVNYKQGLSKDSDAKVEIIVEDVNSLEGAKTDENIFALTDAISQKNKALALQLFERELDAGAADVYLVHMIIRQFRILLQVRQGMDNGQNAGQIASQLKLHPFVVNKSFQQVRNFDLETLKSIFHSLVEIDQGIKTGTSDFKTQISLLIANI